MEIIIFIIAFLYIIYSIFIYIHIYYKNIKNKISLKKKKRKTNKVILNYKEKNNLNKNNITTLDNNKIINILKRVKVNSSKGYLDTSRILIIEGLSIDKNNKDLNLELALIYEKEKKYKNAKYIYKDLLEFYKSDFSINKKLANIYIMEQNIDKAMIIYEKLHKKNKSDTEIINILSDITFNIGNYTKSLKYTNLYLISNPRNIEKLFIKAKCLKSLGEINYISDIYKRILDLQPYNTRAKNKLKELKK